MSTKEDSQLTHILNDGQAGDKRRVERGRESHERNGKHFTNTLYRGYICSCGSFFQPNEFPTFQAVVLGTLRHRRTSVPYAKRQVRHAAKYLSLVTWNNPKQPQIKVGESREEASEPEGRNESPRLAIIDAASQMQQCRPTVSIHSASSHPSFSKFQPPFPKQSPYVSPAAGYGQVLFAYM